MSQDQIIFTHRRQKLLQKLPNNSITILPAANIQFRNSDSEYLFRQNSDFYYLTGINEPDGMLVLTKDQNSKESYIIFSQKKDPKIERWIGSRIGKENLCENYNVNIAYELEELNDQLPKLMLGSTKIYTPIGQSKKHDLKIFNWLKQARRKRKNLKSPKAIEDLLPFIHALRAIKEPSEIDNLKQAANVSCDAHSILMQFCKPGLMEYQLASLFKHHCQSLGFVEMAYTEIVASGNNACTLHYIDNNSQLSDGDLLLVDAGCESEYYAADITRTYPINGEFTSEQKIIYEIVLRSQLAGIKAVKPGNKWSEIQKAILKEMVRDLVQINILKGDIDKLIKEKAFEPYYMHRSGHFLGLDVHDPGLESDDMILQPGMVLTVEPGLYISPDLKCDKKWHGIGVRIEDDILVTETGNEVLTKNAPKTVEEIEKIMQTELVDESL